MEVYLPLSSSFFVFFLNVFHQDAKSRFDGGDVAVWAATTAGCWKVCGLDGERPLPVAILDDLATRQSALVRDLAATCGLGCNKGFRPRCQWCSENRRLPQSLDSAREAVATTRREKACS